MSVSSYHGRMTVVPHFDDRGTTQHSPLSGESDPVVCPVQPPDLTLELAMTWQHFTRIVLQRKRRGRTFPHCGATPKTWTDKLRRKKHWLCGSGSTVGRRPLLMSPTSLNSAGWKSADRLQVSQPMAPPNCTLAAPHSIQHVQQRHEVPTRSTQRVNCELCDNNNARQVSITALE